MNHNVISHDVEPVTPLDLLVGMVSKTATQDEFGALKAMTIRVPLVTACTLEALMAHSGMSRNKLVVKSLEAAFDLLWQQLSPVERETIEAHRSMILGQALKDLSSIESGEV